MKVENILAQDINAAGDKASYDAAYEKLLGRI